MFTNLLELIKSMPDENTCRQYLIDQRWNGKPVCPHCGCDRSYIIENGKKIKCANKECYRKYSCIVGTIFESSKIPLTKWFTAIYLIASHKKGISSYQLAKDIGIAQKNAWFVLHRIREMMRDKAPDKLDNIVEIDETYIGGKVANMSNSKRAKIKETGIVPPKAMVMGMIERAGKLKLISMIGVNPPSVQPAIRDNVDTDAVIITDSHAGYTGLSNEYAGHEAVNHTIHEYVRDEVWHTNTIEGAFSQFKRSIYGIYHQCSAKHLSRYCDETMFRYNLRKMKDTDRFTLSLGRVNGRLDYKTLVNRNNTAYLTPSGLGFRIAQVKDGVVIAEFNSIREAGRKTGIRHTSIARVLKGGKPLHGFEWKYL